MRVATDIGGTFTDLVAIGEDGTLVQEKAHTTPPNFEAGVMDVLEKSGVKPESITAFFHGTTTIINALTERKGAKTALLTTRGFRDVLELARGNRPDLFNMVFEKPAPFIPRYLRREVTERVSYDGKVITPSAARTSKRPLSTSKGGRRGDRRMLHKQLRQRGPRARDRGLCQGALARGLCQPFG